MMKEKSKHWIWILVSHFYDTPSSLKSSPLTLKHCCPGLLIASFIHSTFLSLQQQEQRHKKAANKQTNKQATSQETMVFGQPALQTLPSQSQSAARTVVSYSAPAELKSERKSLTSSKAGIEVYKVAKVSYF
jgi:hypothetical protein